jgi:hypothetical protein
MCWDPPSINFLVYAIDPITYQFDFYFKFLFWYA